MITASKSELQRAFELWEERFRERPTDYMSEAERVLKQTPKTHAESSAAYLCSLLHEVQN
jgi:hypothetical protein